MASYVAYILLIVLYGPHKQTHIYRHEEPSFEHCLKDGTLLDKAMTKKYKAYTLECQRRFEVDT